MRTPAAFTSLFSLLLVAAPAAAMTTSDTPLKLQLDGPLFALVQDDDFLDDGEGSASDDVDDEEAYGAPAEEVKPGGATVGETVGGAVGFVRRTGFYTASDLGGFIRFGGWADAQTCFRCVQRPTSNLQPYIGLSVGYDIFDWLGVQASFGTGFVANAAPLGDPNGFDHPTPRDYGITFVNLAVLGSFWIDRFGIVGKVFGGAALLQPPPLPDDSPFGGNVGAGLGVRWATLLNSVTIGIDVNGYLTFAPAAGGMTMIPSLSFAPVIKYVF